MKFKKYNNLIFSFILIAIFFFFASLLPVYAQGVGKDISNQDEIKQEELSIKLKALQVANEIDKYLKDHPNLTLKQLQEDNDFKNIAVQKVGENGYTGVIDSQSGYFYFHPQEKLINTDSHSLKEKLPDFWKIFSRTIGEECREASGHYKWLEADSKETEKYLYTACVERATADGKKLFVGATAYINETTAKKYLNKYDIKNSFYYSQRFIKQRSFDIAKQVELYIKANPKKTLEDFKNDSIFRELAIQRVGESGYTYLVNHKNGSMDFHPDPKIEGKSYNAFKDKFPIIWNMIDSSIQANPCADSEGFYKWADIEGKIRDKYTYHHCIDAQTADGYSFFLGASTYLDEYKDINEESMLNQETGNKIKQEELLRNAQGQVEKLKIIIDGFSRDIKSLSQTIGIKELLKQVEEEGILTNNDIEKKFYPKDKGKYWNDVYEYFLRFYNQNPDEIIMLRLLHKNGFVVSGVINGEEDIRDYKGDKSWFKDTMNPDIVSEDEVYISPISIARLTNKPVIRYIMPIDVEGERLGLIIINFKASAIFKTFDDNSLFLDKAYENAEGKINTEWVTTLYDSRYPELSLSENRADASLILPEQLKGDSGFIEFMDKGENFVAAYQKANIDRREWYVASVSLKDDLIIPAGEDLKKNNLEKEGLEDHKDEINSFILVYWIIAFIFLMFLILFILNYFHIIKIGEKFIVFLLGGTSLILIILFIFSAYQVARNMKKNNLDTYGSQQMFLAEQAVKNTENNLEFLINNIQVNAENYNFLAEDKIKNHAYLENLFKISNKYVESINLLDSQGILLDEVYSQEAKLYPHNSKDFSKKPGVAELIKNRKLKISDIFKNHLEKGMLSILIPINHQDTLKGILRVNILLSTIFKNNFDSLMDSRIKMLRLFTKNDSYMFDGSASNIPAPMLKIINKKEAYNFLDLAHDPALANKYSGEFLKTNYPLEIGGNHWNLILATPVKNIYSSIVQDVNRIWYFTISIIIAIILIVFIFNFILSKSFKKQIFNKTKEIADSNRIISEQLKKEEQSRKEKENLIKNQKKVQEELEEKLDELSKFQKVTIDRELKMIELKEKLKNIKNKKT